MKERLRRNRTGGVVDRRFGENDPDMDPEEKMLERLAREKQVGNVNGVNRVNESRSARGIRHCIILKMMLNLRILDNLLLKWTNSIKMISCVYRMTMVSQSPKMMTDSR